jgi:hypothetical protein
MNREAKIPSISPDMPNTSIDIIVGIENLSKNPGVIFLSKLGSTCPISCFDCV